jgi:uncharacterized protein YqgQ
MEIEIEEEPTEVVIDTGSGCSLISKIFLESIGREIEQTTNVDLIDVNGSKKRALGKIRIATSINGERIAMIEMQVTDAYNYNVILGNDWLVKMRAEINPELEIITMRSHGQEDTYPIKTFRDQQILYLEGDEEYESQEIKQTNTFFLDNEQTYDINELIQKYKNGDDWDDLEEEELEYMITEQQLNDIPGEKPPKPLPEYLTDQQKENVESLLWEYDRMFAKGLFDLGKADRVEHRIPIKEEFPFPVWTKRRYYSDEDTKFMREEIQKMFAAGIIQDSHGSWSSAPVMVPKKNGKKRACIDFRPLNKRTHKDKYPLPEIERILKSFKGAKYYTTLDAASGYWQVMMAPEDRQKTAFQFEQGYYEFKVMPFGLTNAPATFQRLMDSILRDLIGDFVQVYLDDIIIYSRTWEEHMEHIETIFQRLEKAGLKLGRDKCDFAQKEIDFLGHIVNREGIKPDPKKLELIQNWKPPTNKSEIRSFVGLMSYYRQFIENFAVIATPLTSMQGEKKIFKWGKEQQEAFETLKEKMLEAAPLEHPDFNKQFIISTDASLGALGAVLSQLDEEGRERPIAFASKTLTGAETRYSPTELELLAIKWAVTDKFKQYIIGREFTVYSDHEALGKLGNNKEINNKKLARWIMALEGYDITINYRSGKKNQNADALSRMNTYWNLCETWAETPRTRS